MEGVVGGAVVGGDAALAVDTGGVVLEVRAGEGRGQRSGAGSGVDPGTGDPHLAVEADSASSEVAVHVQAGPGAVYLGVVEAVEGVAVAVAL